MGGMLRAPLEKLRLPQSWAASASRLLTRDTQAPSQSKEMPRGCTRPCQAPWGHTGAGDGVHGEEHRDRQTDT